MAATSAIPAWPGLTSAIGDHALSNGVAVRAIALNQLGFLPHRQKEASVVFAADADARKGGGFAIEDAQTGSPLLRGTLGPLALDPASGDWIAPADFSALNRPGQYRLAIGERRSDVFSIGNDAYRDALRMVMRGFYGQRCGCAVDLGGGYAHPACHSNGGFHPSSGRSGPLPNAGGWHDAGDYGRYVVNSGISTATLLWAWEMFPEALQHLHLGIPESHGRVPDFLAEVRWNLQWMLQMQDKDGGVWHKQTSDRFCAFVMPELDTMPSQVIGTGEPPYKSTCATADFAAVIAIAARCYRPFDAAFAERCLLAARQAYRWAAAHPDIRFRNPPAVTTGEYGDPQCNDELLWAAAELFRTTKDEEFERAFLASLQPLVPALAIDTPSWSSVGAMGLWSYCLAGRNEPSPVRSAIRTATVAAAEERSRRGAAAGYRNTLALTDYVWGSNAVAANDALLLLVAHRLHPDVSYVRAALANLDYLLGRNCFGISWVTGLGTRSLQHPHHRPSAADGIEAPWPGLLAGGPNARGADPVASSMGKGPPMRMWVDDQRAYSMNEIAINWNAPLVFLLAAANSAALIQKTDGPAHGPAKL